MQDGASRATMRSRRMQAQGQTDAEEIRCHPPSSSTSSANAAAAADAALLDECAVRLRKSADNLERQRPSLWRMRCSSSILIGLLIWGIIGLVVYTQIHADGPLSEASRELLDGGAAAATADALLPEGCRGDVCFEEGGTEAFGAVLGAHDGVYAYSNCFAHTCISFLDFSYPVPIPPGSHTALDDPKATTRLMRTGMKWQCVEYARRYWMLRGRPVPAVLDSVGGAADIWDQLSSVTLLDNVTTTPLLKYANGAAVGYGGSEPRVGDLVIYPRDDDGKFPYGHVAVIVGVALPVAPPPQTSEARWEGVVYIAEQNWHSSPWPEPYHNYSRALPLWATPPGTPARYTIHDDYHSIQGWVRYGDA